MNEPLSRTLDEIVERASADTAVWHSRAVRQAVAEAFEPTGATLMNGPGTNPVRAPIRSSSSGAGRSWTMRRSGAMIEAPRRS